MPSTHSHFLLLTVLTVKYPVASLTQFAFHPNWNSLPRYIYTSQHLRPKIIVHLLVILVHMSGYLETWSCYLKGWERFHYRWSRTITGWWGMQDWVTLEWLLETTMLQCGSCFQWSTSLMGIIYFITDYGNSYTSVKTSRLTQAKQ